MFGVAAQQGAGVSEPYMLNTFSMYSKRPLKGHVFYPKYVEYVEYEVEYVLYVFQTAPPKK